jgi:murein DD-endopeptidase MepM/ murein hydrolase activator NlpD
MSVKIRHPVEKLIISQGFGENPQVYARFGLAGHNGWDYAVAVGTGVMAAAGGTVEALGFDADGYGNYLKLNHGGFLTLYGHLSVVYVNRGELVEIGQEIGLSGNTGFSTGPHLHFELRIPGQERQGYPAGEVDPGPYFMAVENDLTPEPAPAVPGGRSAGKGEDDQDDRVRVKYDGVRLRLTPQIPEKDTLGNVRGAVYQGEQLRTVDKREEWYGVVMWIHESCVSDGDTGG